MSLNITRRAFLAKSLPVVIAAPLSLRQRACAQNVIERAESELVVAPVEVTIDHVDRVLGRTFSPGDITGETAFRFQRKLDRHVAEFLEGWPWLPFHHTLGISGYEAYFGHPEELFYTMALCLPFLQPSTADRAREFMQERLAELPPYNTTGWNTATGRPREAYDVPHHCRIAQPPQANSAVGIYSLWAWCHATGDTQAAASHFAAAKSRIEPLLSHNYSFDVNKKDYSFDESEKLNGDIAGLIGYCRLATMSDDNDAQQSSREHLRALLELRLNLDRVNAHVLEKTRATKSLHVNKLARYCAVVPELAKALRTQTDGCAATRVETFRLARNGWYMAFGDRLIGGENYTNPLHLARTLFVGAALIENRPATELFSFIDVPWCHGDFYFMEKCALALWVASGRKWRGTRV